MHGTHFDKGENRNDNSLPHIRQTGKVEVFDNNRWGGVCHSQFNTAESKANFAKATCRTLGQLQGEWNEPRTEDGAIAQRSMNCSAGDGEQLNTCKAVSWQVTWFVKKPKGSPKSSAGAEQSMWALKYTAPQNNLQRALKDCLMMPGCFSVGYVVPSVATAEMVYASKQNLNAVKFYNTNSGFTQNIDNLRQSSGYCEITQNMDFSMFSNRSSCDGGTDSHIGWKQTITINSNAGNTWWFTPRTSFQKGGVVLVDRGTGDVEVASVRHAQGAVQNYDDTKGELDFSAKVSGKTVIKIYGATQNQDITQRIYQKQGGASAPAMQSKGNSMTDNGWRLLSPTNLAEENSQDVSSADTYQFFVDKAYKYSEADHFSKQMPYYAVEEVSRKNGEATGAPSSYGDYGSAFGPSNLQTQSLLFHDDLNTASATEFGYHLDGSSNLLGSNWDADEPAKDKHFVYETKGGKFKTADVNQDFSCVTCEMGTGEQRVMGKYKFWGAVKACRNIGGDLPKKIATVDKSNLSYDLEQCKTDIQSPQFLQRENFGRYSSKYCKQAVVTCVGNHVCAKGCVSNPKGYGRLIGDDGKVVVSYIPNEGFLTSENFVVSSSPGKEMGRWDSQNTKKAVVGYQVQFRPDESLSYAGPESTFTLTWHQETITRRLSRGLSSHQIVKDFNNSDLSKNTAGYSGAQNVPGRGSYWIWFNQDYFQKEGYGCKQIKFKGDCPNDGVERFRCVFFAKMFLPPLTGVKHSFTWVYLVTQDTCEEISTGKLVSDSMQCKDPDNCPNATNINGINIKAADYASCSFENPPNDDGSEPAPLNKKVIKAGTDINIRCQWDTKSLKYGSIDKWDQGMDGVTPTSEEQKEIRKKGYPNNSHIKTYPYSCLAGMGRQSEQKLVSSNKQTSSLKWTNWTFIILTCDQQFNGSGTYHELVMRFVLNKSMARRRLKQGDNVGDEGTFGYNLRSGRCIKDENNTANCPDEGTVDGTGNGEKPDFALWFSLMALFALY